MKSSTTTESSRTSRRLNNVATMVLILVSSAAISISMCSMFDVKSYAMSIQRLRKVSDASSSERIDDSPSKTPKAATTDTLRTLPPPFINGGIFIFLHIPKTGGTTMRQFLENRTDYLHIARFGGQFKNMTATMDTLVRNGTNRKVLSFEVHDSCVPPYVNFSSTIREWKHTAAANNVSLFVYALMRDPVAFQVSSFNYYYIPPKLANNTIDEFLGTLLFNAQCHFLTRGGGFFNELDRNNREDKSKVNMLRKESNENLTKAECDDAFQLLHNDMDWINTSDKLTTEMIPILNYYLTGNVTEAKGPASHFNISKNVSRKQMTLDRLNATELQYVHDSVRFEQEWYGKTQDVFRDWKHAIRKDAAQV